MYETSKTVEKIKMIAKSKGISVKDLLESCELNKNTLSSMTSRGSWLQANSLAKIADYLDCSVDYLLGRTDNKKAFTEGNLSEGNVVRLAGRDGSYFEKVLPDDLYEILKKFIDSLDENHDPRL